MILDRDKEMKNHGKETQFHQPCGDICSKLKQLNLTDSEASKSSEEKLKVTDNISKMKDLMINNFGDEAINKIGNQFRNIKIEEYNFPPSKKTESQNEIVLNIVCDNKIEDIKNCKKDSNINSDEEQFLSNENKRPVTDVGLKERYFEEKVNGKLVTETSSLIENEVEKQIKADESSISKSNASDVSKETDENIEVLCSRGPVSQKICQQTFQPYNNWTCSRLHSGGKVRVAENPGQPTTNGCQQWTEIPYLNIIPNGSEQSSPPVQTSYLPMIERHSDVYVTAADTEQGASWSPEDMNLVKTLAKDPRIRECCDMLNRSSSYLLNTETTIGGDINQNKLEELVPSSPEDSATYSLDSPGGSFYQPPSVGGWSDSGVEGESPLHGVEYPADSCVQSPYEKDGTDYCVLQGIGNQRSVVAQEWQSIQGWQPTQKWQSIQEWQTSQERSDIQGRQSIQERPDIQGRQSIQERPGIQGRQSVQERPDIQGRQSVQERPDIQGRQSVQERPDIQGRQSIQERPDIQGRQSVQERPEIPGRQTVHVRPDTQGRQAIQENQTVQEELDRQTSQGKVTRYRQILPKPEISSAKASNMFILTAKTRFQQILDKERRLLAWLNVTKTLNEDKKVFERQDSEGDTDLMIICSNKYESQLEMIYAMVEKMRHIPNCLTITNNQGHSALYLACKLLFDVPVVAAYIAEALLEQKVDIANMNYDGGRTLIQILEKEGDSHKKVLEELLALKDSSGKSVFQPCGNDVNANNLKIF